MKKLYLILVTILLGIQVNVYAQDDGGVSIGKGDADADPSAILELVSSNKGLLIPRLTESQRVGISSPASGLLVYDTDKSNFYYWNGSEWTPVPGIKAASEISVTASGDLTSTDVQSALEELQGEIITVPGSGMTSVVHDATLTGNGVTGSELGIANNGVSLAKIANGGRSQVMTTDASGNPLWQDITSIQDGTGTDDQGLFDVLGNGNDAGGSTITNLGAPTVSTDAATKNYVDTELSGVEKQSNKNMANGYVGLGSDSKVNQIYLPTMILGNTYVVADETAQLALTVTQGDVAVRTDESKTYINNSGSNSSMGDWTELISPDGEVQSVNAEIGTVVLDLADILTQGNNAGGKVISGITNPVDAQDAATKNYVDTQLGGLIDADNQKIDVLSLSGTTLNISLENDGEAIRTIDLSGIDDQTASEVTYDNTTSGLTATDVKSALDEVVAGSSDDQELSLSSNILSIENGTTTVDLSAYLDNTDDQTASEVSYDNTTSGLTATDVKSALDEVVAGSSDDQELSLSSNILSIENGTTTVDLSAYLDNTDDQTASEVSYDNTTSGLTATDVKSALDEVVAGSSDDQELSLSSNILSIENGTTTVDLSAYLDNTDDQTASEVSYDNTTSGLIATDVKSALDEVAVGSTDDQTASEVSYDNTTSGLTATNVKSALDEVAVGSTDDQTASEVSYDNTTSGLTATDVKSALDEVAVGSTDDQTASEVSYDNTTSGLTATDVKSALDEVAVGSTDDQTASEVSYDNTTSGLTATDVKSALDEVVAGSSDDQELSLSSNILSIENGTTTVDLSAYLDNTDDQTASEVSYDNTTSGLTATDVKSALDEVVAGSSDDQELSLSSNILSIENGTTTVDLSAYLDNTDDQTASEVSYDNTTSGLTATDVKSALDEVAAGSSDDQELSLSSNILSIENGTTTVDLSAYLDNTDDQTASEVSYDNTTSGLTATDVKSALDEVVAGSSDDQELSLSSNILSIENGTTTVDLSAYLDNTDDQTASEVSYDNTTSGLTATDVKSALDEVAAGSTDEMVKVGSTGTGMYLSENDFDGTGSDIVIREDAVTSSKILNGSIVNDDINATAAIAGTKISPDFGTQDVTTTGNLRVGDGTPDNSMDGEDAYIEGNVEVDGTVTVGAYTLPNTDGTASQVLQTDGSGAVSWTTFAGTIADGSVGNATLRWDGSSWIESGALKNDNTNITVTGDLSVNGGDITTNKTSANLFNTTTTTLNIGGAAISLNLGSSTGTTTIKNDLNIAGNDLSFGNGETISNGINGTIAVTVPAGGSLNVFTGNLKVGDGTPDNSMDGEDAYIEGNVEVDGTVTVGAYTLPNTDGTASQILQTDGSGAISWVDISGTIEDGITPNNTLRWDGSSWIESGALKNDDSNITVSGNLAVNGGDIITGSSSASLFNTTATTLNIGGAVTSLNLGSSTGTTTIKNDLNIAGNDLSFGNGETISNGTNGTIAVTVPTGGSLNVSTGNLKVGDGTPGTITLDGEDAYIEGNVEVDGAVTVGAYTLPNTDGTASQVLQTDGSGAVNWTDIAGTIADGSIGNATLRWDGSSWIESGALKNDNTDITVTGNLAVNGGDITTNKTSASLFNTTAATLNIGGAATSLNLGSSTGTTTIKNDLNITGNDLSFGNGETISNGTNGTIAVTVPAGGSLNVFTGNLKVGDGTPDNSMDGEDAYIEGALEVDGTVTVGEYTLPNTDGSNGQVLVTNGGGALSWTAPEFLLAGTGDYTLRYDVTNGWEASSVLTNDGTDVAISGDLTVNGTIINPSDMRLKKNITTLTGVLGKLNCLRGVRYEFKDQQKYAVGPQVGVIAQELQRVFPELVTQGADGYLAVNYSQLTGVLIQAIKEQQQEIDLLKKQMQQVMKKLGME